MLLFVIYHLLHLTTGNVHPDFVEGDVYRNIVVGFSRWPVSLFYVLAMLCLGLHLRHGISSALQSLGVIPEAWTRRVLTAGVVLTLAIAGGFVLIPIYIYFFL